MKLNPAEKNAIEATKTLLDLGGVHVTKRSLREALWQHPDFPSLNSLNGVLTDFRLPNMATRLSPEQLSEIPLPALAYLNIDGGSYAPIRKVGPQVEWLHTRHGWQSESFNAFVQKWEGITLLIEPAEHSGEPDYAQKRQRERLAQLRTPFVLSVVALGFGILLWSLLQRLSFTTHTTYYSLLATKLAGTVISGLLVWYGIDSQNSFLQKVCQLNNRTNCSTILNSPAANVFSGLSWSEVGLFYFAGGLIALLILPTQSTESIENTRLLPLWALGALALPYTFWSVYHQALVARTWCVLCLSVQALLWAEFLIGWVGLQDSFASFSWPTAPLIYLNLIVAFLIVPAGWVLLKPHLQQSVPYQPLLREFQKIKFSPEYLQALSRQQRVLPPIFEGMKVVELGNPQAENSLW
jgi:uncharacterized membrane protein